MSTFLVIASAPSLLAAMQVVAPNELRGQVNALYLFTLSVLGQGLGPTIVALLTDYVFQADLRYCHGLGGRRGRTNRIEANLARVESYREAVASEE